MPLYLELFTAKKGTESSLWNLLNTPQSPCNRGILTVHRKLKRKEQRLLSVVEKVRLLVLKSLQKKKPKRETDHLFLFSPSPRWEVFCSVILSHFDELFSFLDVV